MIKTYLLQAPTYLEQIFKPLASIVEKFTKEKSLFSGLQMASTEKKKVFT